MKTKKISIPLNEDGTERECPACHKLIYNKKEGCPNCPEKTVTGFICSQCNAQFNKSATFPNNQNIPHEHVRCPKCGASFVGMAAKHSPATVRP